MNWKRFQSLPKFGQSHRTPAPGRHYREATKHTSRSGSAYGDNWAQLSFECKKRDNWTCRECGHYFSRRWRNLLEAHHRIPLSKGGENRLSNLITLCWKCHPKEHTDNRAMQTKAKKRRPRYDYYRSRQSF